MFPQANKLPFIYTPLPLTPIPLTLHHSNSTEHSTPSLDGLPRLPSIELARLSYLHNQVNAAKRLNKMSLLQSLLTSSLMEHQEKKSILEKRNREDEFGQDPASELGDLDLIRKKVKTDQNGSVLSLIREEAAKLPSLDFNPTNSFIERTNQIDLSTRNTSSSSNAESIVPQQAKKVKAKKATGERKITKVMKDKKTKEIIYLIEEDSNKKNKAQETLTKAEIMEKDPMLLIYFYEKKLKVTDAPWFDPETMKKL